MISKIRQCIGRKEIINWIQFHIFLFIARDAEMKSEKRLRRPILYIFFSDPNIFSSQFSRSLSRSSFSCARLRLVRAAAHADAYDLSTPAVD